MKRALTQIALVLCITTSAGMARAQSASTQPSPSADAGLNAQLAQLDANAAPIKDLSARFEQKKFTTLLKKPLISTGTIRAAGPAVRWDTLQPRSCVLHADQSELRLYYPDQKLEEIYSIDQRLGDLLSSPLPRLDTIRRHFRIERASQDDLKDGLDSSARADSALALRLVPSDAELAQHVKKVIVVLDVKTGLTLAVETTDADGDRTQIAFSDVHANTGMDAEQLQLRVPSDTTISHPLDSSPPQSSDGSD